MRPCWYGDGPDDMDRLVAVEQYLRQHWINCRCQQWEKELDLSYYADRKAPYGPDFVERLRAKLSDQLKG